MTTTCPLSVDAKNYLCCFYQTLDEMAQSIAAANLTQSISGSFAAQMIPHCRATVQMSNNILRFSENQAVRRMAQRLAEEQSDRIAELEAILPACARQTNSQLDLRLYQRRMDLILRETLAAMGSGPEHNRLSAVFLREMLPHLSGAVRMAENTLKYDVSLELVPILRGISGSGRRELSRTRALLNRMGCQGTNQSGCQTT